MGGDSSPAIRPIGKSVVHRICSGQVIFDLASAVKELVENSLDAGATTVEVSLKAYGEEWFKVADNGSGISPSNFQALALKHHTSKISDFSDLNSVVTFGFRGEALSSLCALGKLTVETRTKDEPVGTHLEFEHSGVVTSERKTARQVGTIVTIQKLFSTLPVRSKEFSRNIRKEYGKVISLLNAYALIAKGVRLVCTNTVGKNSKMVVLRTQGSSSLKDNIITVFGLNTFKCLEPFNVTISEGCQVEGFLSKLGPGSGRNSGDRQFFYVNGRPVDMPKVTKLVNELYRSSNSKQYPVAILNFCIPTTSYDVNVAPDKRKLFLSSERTILLSLREAIENLYCPQHCNFSINHIEAPEKEEDPAIDGPNEDTDLIETENVSSPENGDDKDETDSDDEVSPESQKMSSSMTSVAIGATSRDVSPMTRGPTTQVDRSAWLSALWYEQPKRLPGEVKRYPVGANHGRPGLAAKSSPSSTVQSSLMNFLSLNKRKHEDSCNLISEAPVLRRGTCTEQVRRTSLEANALVALRSSLSNIPEVNSPQETNPLRHHSPQSLVPERTEVSPQHSEPPNIVSHSTEVPLSGPCKVHIIESDVDEQDDRCLSNFGAPNKYSEEEPQNQLTNIPLPDAHDHDNGTAVCSTSVSYPVMQFTVAGLRRRRKHGFMISHANNVYCPRKTTRCYKAATLDIYVPYGDEGKSNYLTAATNELDRLFSKDDFGEMEVVGQFNLGFIIGKLDQDLFIVDQHAADEKYNFESLSQSTTLNIQPLLQPLRLELSPEEEVIVSMHMSTIRKNGFVLAEDMHACPGNHYLLKAVPFSKNITFGVQDVKELISMLADSQGDCSIISSYKLDRTDSICPSRVRAMLASRACRMSTMIGDPLTKAEMKKILKNLTGLRAPWNCPHGRPTMRHLADLRTIKTIDQNNKRIVLALQSGLKGEILWALNALTVLSFKEKDDLRRDTTPLAKVPGLLDALLQVIDDWRDIAMPKDHTKQPRVRTLGANTTLSGFGHENIGKVYSDTATPSNDQSKRENSIVTKKRSAGFWFDEDGLFNVDDEGRTERQQCAVAASNIIRNLSFMPENETIMVQHRHCLETVFQCLEDQNIEDDELITNMLETLVNLAPVLDLRIFSSSKPSFIKMTEKRAVHAIMGMLASSIKVWHCAAAELIGRLIINPDNESFLLPVIPQIYKRLVDLLSVPALDAQAAAVSALYNVSEVNMDCRLKLASERWAVDRLLKVVKTPHPVPEVCRKSAMILESLVSEPQNRMHLLVHENTFAEILTTEGKYSDTFARILYELTARPSNKVTSGQAIWGNIN